MNDLSLGHHRRCSFVASEPYCRCPKEAFVQYVQCKKPYCFTHAPQGPVGFMCAACALAEAPRLPSRCPNCGGNRIYKPWWKGVRRLIYGHQMGSARWSKEFVSGHTYAYYCFTCFYHWDPDPVSPDGDDGATDEEEERE